jgi:hypothetical protein
MSKNRFRFLPSGHFEAHFEHESLLENAETVGFAERVDTDQLGLHVFASG